MTAQARIWIAAAASTALLGTGELSGQRPSPTYRNRVLGVFDARTGDPIEGAEVADLRSGTWAATTKTGTISLSFLPDGGAVVRVRKLGYAQELHFVAISPADTLPVTIMLTSVATTLPTVRTTDSIPRHVSPGLQAFEARRAAGIGRFLSEAELRKSDSRTMMDLLRGISGVDVRCGRRPGGCYALSSRGGCRLTAYLDGALVTDSDLSKMSVADYGGIEVYTSLGATPTQYNMTGSGCGVVLFWTRER